MAARRRFKLEPAPIEVSRANSQRKEEAGGKIRPDGAGSAPTSPAPAAPAAVWRRPKWDARRVACAHGFVVVVVSLLACSRAYSSLPSAAAPAPAKLLVPFAGDVRWGAARRAIRMMIAPPSLSFCASRAEPRATPLAPPPASVQFRRRASFILAGGQRGPAASTKAARALPIAFRIVRFSRSVGRSVGRPTMTPGQTEALTAAHDNLPEAAAAAAEAS